MSADATGSIISERAVADPVLTPALTERVLARLGFRSAPSTDLEGLNAVYAAFSGAVPFDNVVKRIWFAGEQRGPFPLGEPAEFFESWLDHGTGGTCWPINGALCALLGTLGFRARRIGARIVVPMEVPPEWTATNHGSVVVTLGDGDYLVDGWMGSFEALPLSPHTATSTGSRLHGISASPADGRWEIRVLAGHNREQALPVFTEPEHDPVSHDFFLARYEMTRKIAFFNDCLYITRRFPDRIITVGREHRVSVDADNAVSKTVINDTERRRVLVEELGLSEAIVAALPPDAEGVPSLV